MRPHSKLYKAFPIKDFGLVGWAEVQELYERFEYIFGFELLETIMARGGFELKEWIAIKSGDEMRVRQAFNWYSDILLGKRQVKGQKMTESNAVRTDEAPSVAETVGLKIVEKIEKFGAGTWELLHKESSKSDGWAETTKVMEIPGVGAVVKVTCSCRNDSGVTVLTNATTFIPGVFVARSSDTAGTLISRQLAPFKTAAPKTVAPAQTERPVQIVPVSATRGKRKGKKKSTKSAQTAKAAAKPAVKKKHKGRGRPKGSKNKPK